MGREERGIQEPIKGGEVREKGDMFKVLLSVITKFERKCFVVILRFYPSIVVRNIDNFYPLL